MFVIDLQMLFNLCELYVLRYAHDVYGLIYSGGCEVSPMQNAIENLCTATFAYYYGVAAGRYTDEKYDVYKAATWDFDDVARGFIDDVLDVGSIDEKYHDELKVLYHITDMLNDFCFSMKMNAVYNPDK